MSIPVTRWVDPPMPSEAIYAFLGVATLPRLLPGNPLRHLPREMVLRVAQFAYSPAYRASWSHPWIDTADADGREAVEVDVVPLIDAYGAILAPLGYYRGLRVSRPIRRGVTYVEVTLNCAWYGTGVQLAGLGQDFRLALTCDDRESPAINTAHLTPYNNGDEYLAVRNFDGCWTWMLEPVVFGLLIDMTRGCCTFYLNGRVGPCVRFPVSPPGAQHWRQNGVRIEVDEFPDDNDQRPPQCLVSCASRLSPPTPVSVPMTPQELWDKGDLYVEV